MGADLMISYVIRKGKMKNEKRKEKMLKVVESMPLKWFEEQREYYNDNLYKEFGDGEEVKQFYRDTIDKFFKCLDYRDVTTIEHKGETLILSGGMSWGDYPTESYDTLCDFYELNNLVLKSGGFE